MRKLNAFNFTTINGYYKGPDQDISWHRHGSEENEYSAQSLQTESILLFGRVTYEMMAGYWPTADAIHNNPSVANGMNRAEKIVFSTTLKNVAWNNTTIVGENIIDYVKKLKLTPGNDLAILGSGSIITQFADHGLIDEYQIMIDPVAIGRGTSIFSGLKQTLNLQLKEFKHFKSGTILLNYQPL